MNSLDQTAAVARALHPSRSHVVRALVALVIVATLAGCWGHTGPGAAYYAELLASLEVPAGWELAHTREREGMFGPNACGPGDSTCPGAHRYYHVEGFPLEGYPVARQAVVDGGFEITRENEAACDPQRQGAGSCRLVARRGSDAVEVLLYEPGRDVDDLGIGREGLYVIEVRAYQYPGAERAP